MHAANLPCPPSHRCLPQGGNDFEIFESPDTIGHTVSGPDDTIRQLRELFPSPPENGSA